MEKKLFRNRSIREKLLISCILVTLIPMMIMELVFVMQTKNSAYEQEIRSAGADIDRLQYSYSVEFEKAETVVDMLAENPIIDTFLNYDFGSTASERKYYLQNISPLISPYNNTDSGIRIRIAHRHPSKNIAIEVSEDLDTVMKKYFPDKELRAGNGVWTSIDGYTFHPVISYYMPVVDSSNYKNIAYMVSAHIKEKYLYSYISNEPVSSRIIIVADKNGTILSSNERVVIGKNLLQLLNINEPEVSAENGLQISFENASYRMLYRSMEHIDLYMLISDAILKDQVRNSIYRIVAVGISLMLISITLLVLLTNRMTARMRNLTEKMSSVDRSMIHEMAKEATYHDSRDEVDRMDHAFTKMMSRIDDLVETVQDDQRRISEEVITRQAAELKFLQQQINPHYLFNTLESIRMNLVCKNDMEDANIVKLFGESFRRYIDMKDEYSTLYEELIFLEKYIKIQNYRLNNKIRYTCTECGAAMSVRIPKLLIQPVVENAVIHAFEDRPNGGEIRVETRRKNSMIYIIVKDDGAGMSEEELMKLKEHVYCEEEGGSIGLRNVYRRLKLVYGDKAGMEIKSEIGEGTAVTIRVPEDNTKKAAGFGSEGDESVQSITG